MKTGLNKNGFLKKCSLTLLPKFSVCFLIFCSPIMTFAELLPAPAPVENFKITGMIQDRMILNLSRLDTDRYAPVEKTGAFKEASYNWAGDMEGRALLSMVRLEKATGRTSKNLAGIRALWPQRLNPDGYFGKRLDVQAIDEQQLSGHGWVLRALCELYEWKRQPEVLNEIRLIVKNLVLPTKGAHAEYPILVEDRIKGQGGVSGHAVQKIGRWVLSTDVGCDMIFMDGVIHAATLLKDPKLDSLCEEIYSRFLDCDLAKIQAQTHASLTGMRGLLRWAAYKKQLVLVAEVEKRFKLYLQEGMTEDYSNWNWFGRPTHTEPCAIVDSFMVAQQLWELTGKPEYLESVHRIVYNGFLLSQVPNGGFGCMEVTGGPSGVRDLKTHKIGEAWFCCTMRGSEGFAELSERSIYSDEQGIYATGLNSGSLATALKQGEFQAQASGGYPLEGCWILNVEKAPEIPIAMRFFFPSWGSNPQVVINGAQVKTKIENGFVVIKEKLKPKDKLTYSFDQKIYTQPTKNKFTKSGLLSYNYGPLVLGLSSENPMIDRLFDPKNWVWDQTASCGRCKEFDGILSPLNELYIKSHRDSKKYRRQILFEDKQIDRIKSP